MTTPTDFYCAECDAHLGPIVELCPGCDQAVCLKHWDPINGTCLECPPQRLNHEGVEVPDVRNTVATQVATAMANIEQREASKRKHFEARLIARLDEKISEFEERWSDARAQLAQILKDTEVLT